MNQFQFNEQLFQGLMDMEEACDAARSIMTANQNAALLVLFPVQHTSCDKAVTVKNRRLVEDRLMQSLDAGVRLLDGSPCLL